MEPELIDYDLPPELIAQEPPVRRDEARLLLVDRKRKTLEHLRFQDIADHLGPGDLLVLNDTRVIPARLRAHRSSGGAVEILLLEEEEDRSRTWKVLLRPGRAGREGAALHLEDPDGGRTVTARVVGRSGEVFFLNFLEEGRLLDRNATLSLCEALGETPLPPYIRREPGEARNPLDRERYQTVYASNPGAVAAPTAGLHFTRELLARLESRGVESVPVTLHVGLDTFKPLSPETLQSGKLHGEWIEVSGRSGERLLAARREGRRIVAVGTTSVRVLESFAASPSPLSSLAVSTPAKPAYRERTTLFIRPGHSFRMVDALITNFHLPRSSLLLLVSAFAGRELVLRAYAEARKEKYRFYSYGDAMLIS